MYYISKLFWGMSRPGMLLVLLLTVGLLLLATRFQRTAKGLLIAALALLVIGGISPLSTWMIVPLEERFHRPALGDRPIDGIIVLGGGEEARIAAGRGVHGLSGSGERITEAVELARRYPAAKVVYAGGVTEILRQPVSIAEAGGAVLRGLGIGDDRLILEGASRNTWENARFTRDLVQPKPGERWVVVTSAWHMPRAIGNFRKAGFDVEPWPVDYRTLGWGDMWSPIDNPVQGLNLVDIAGKEWIGLVFNWLSGRTDALFPAPADPAAAHNE
ncbi:YdcF family protein [Hyphomicrobium sp. D-2]|uniref:YdcF family protein n=1 Tax=Hyphomicrobium sp. D-2 TaxID=3041621 RepID=UPI0024576672|nr:YdcF family protein [Hyphomicrobium sp. D-2]MDH4982946.1 YdcF family protein [Hyphomicrobium sp. D-2]